MGFDPLTWALIGSTVVSGASAVSQMSQANRTKKRSESMRLEKVRQAELMGRVSEANRRRQSRISAARLRASTGASGFGGSILESPLLGMETSTTAQIDINQQQTNSQIAQFGISASQTAADANAKIGEALGTFASTAINNYPDMSFETQDANPLGLTPGQGL